MHYIIKYFWSLSIICAAVNTFFLIKRMPKTEDAEAAAEQKKVVAGYFLFFALPCLLLQIFQLAGKYETPLYIFSGDFSNVFYRFGICSVFLDYIVLLVVAVKFKNFEKYSLLLFRKEMSRKRIIVMAVGISLFAVVIIFFGTQQLKDEIAAMQIAPR